MRRPAAATSPPLSTPDQKEKIMGEVISFMDSIRKTASAAVAPVKAAVAAPAPLNLDEALPTVKTEAGNEVFDYGRIVNAALLSVVRMVLANASKHGLAQAAQLYITFNTTAQGCEMPDWLRQRHPEKMTIVLDQWWRDLEVTEAEFTVTLNFSDTPAMITVPFTAIEAFADPSCSFGLGFMREAKPEPEPPQVA
jgi:hypothetical protein